MFQIICLSNLYQLLQMINTGVYASVGRQSHQVKAFACFLSIAICLLDARILHNAVVTACTVNLYQILVYYTPCTNIEVPNLTVTHLTVGQSDILATRLKLSVWTCRIYFVKIRCRRVVDNIRFTFVSYSPSIKDHQKNFLCHCYNNFSCFKFAYKITK